MDIKQAIRELQKLERQRMDAIANGDASKEDKYDGMIGRIQDACNLWVDMAETAIELVCRMRDVPNAANQS